MLLGYFGASVTYSIAISARTFARTRYYYDPGTAPLVEADKQVLARLHAEAPPVHLLAGQWPAEKDNAAAVGSTYALCTTVYMRNTAWRTHLTALLLGVLVGGGSAAYITAYPAEE